MDCLDTGHAFYYNMNLKLNFKIKLRMEIMRFLTRLFVFMLAIAMLGMICSSAVAEESLNIVCTSFPCYDFARAVVGDDAQVRMLIKPGAEIHSYEPTPADVLAIAECDLFVYIGGESDAWVVDILESFGKDAPEVLRLFDIVEAHAEAHEHDSGHIHAYDEHIWTSPKNAVRMVGAVLEAICAIAPDAADRMSERGNDYIAQIEQIDNAFVSTMENAKRNVMIFADRFPFIYFAETYGIEWQAAFDSCSSESEPSARTMMDLISRIQRENIPVVYTIELSSGKTAQTIADETGVEICTFHSVQNVTEADFASGESYVSLMQKNVLALEKGLN